MTTGDGDAPETERLQQDLWVIAALCPDVHASVYQGYSPAAVSQGTR